MLRNLINAIAVLPRFKKVQFPRDQNDPRLVFVPGQLEGSREYSSDICENRQHERDSDNAEKQTEKSALKCLRCKVAITCTK